MSREKDYFIDNLAMLAASGLDLAAALSTLKHEAGGARLGKTIAALLEEVEAGIPFWRTLGKTRLLPAHAIALIKIGEESGRLSENLGVISLELQKERILRAKVQGALIYPVLVLTLAAVIGLGVAWFILPRLANVFLALRLELPLITRFLISVGEFFGRFGWLVVPLFLIGLVILIYFVFIFSRTKWLGQALLWRLPGLRRLIQEVELARFGTLLGALLEAGLPLIEALDSLRQATVFAIYQKFYGFLREHLEEGYSFEKGFALDPSSSALIPLSVQHLIAAGEQSGRLPQTLRTIGQTFETKSELTTKNLTVILEPILLVIVWLGVMFVALAVILPIYSLIGGFGRLQ